MGYTLECYLLNWDELRDAFGSGRRELYEETLKTAQSTGILESARKRGHRVEQAIESLILGGAGRELAHLQPDAKVPPAEAADEFALAFTALIRTLGAPAGELVHSMRAGPQFRDTFFEEHAQSHFQDVDISQLLSRPLFGRLHSEFPSWGGLSAPEVAAAFKGKSADEIPPGADSDEDDWMHSLFTVLDNANQAQSDIVTLYL